MSENSKNKHEIRTRITNKVALTSLDITQYFLSDLVTTIPFDLTLTINDEIVKQIIGEEKWEDSFQGEQSGEKPISVSLDMQLCCSPTYSVPDQGFRLRRYSDRELNCDNTGSIILLKDHIPRNLIIFEAREEKG